MDGKTIIGLLNNYVNLFNINRRTFTGLLLIIILIGELSQVFYCIGLIMGEFLDTL